MSGIYAGDPHSASIMSAMDRMSPGFRALVHEFGFKIVDAMMADGYDNAADLRTVLEGWRERRQEQWLKTDYTVTNREGSAT